MLTVAVDATPLVGERTGIGKAVAGLIGRLAARGGLDLVGYGLTGLGWKEVGRALPSGARACRGPMPAGLLLRRWERSATPPIEWWTGSVDVVHGTNFVVPPSRRAGRLVTVWDLTAARFPQLCTLTSRRYPALVRRAIEEGAWVHTAAEAIAKEIIDFYGAAADRVRVIPPGIDVVSEAPPSRPGGPPYLLGLGMSEPRKDFPSLVAAFDEVARIHPDLELRIAGPAGWAEDDLQAAIARSPNQDRIRRLGWVEDVARLLAGARAFVFPSVYEGFGYPPLEAMAAGVPVVATEVGALPEVIGDAGLLVPARDAEGLAGAILRVIEDEPLRRHLVERGRSRAASFGWDTASEAMQGLYQEMASKP